MAWPGYVQYAGNEIINVARTEKYARQARLPWFKPVYKNDSLGPMLGDGIYSSPLQDDAPWTDPNTPESYRFYGVYPLDINGLEDSSRSSQVTESTGPGGNVGRVRHGTKSVVFSAVLIGEDDAALDYGFKWLKQATLPGVCGAEAGDCSGDEMCYLSAEPAYDEGVSISIVADVPGELLDVDGGEPGDGFVDDWDGGTPSGGGDPVDLDGGTPTTTTGVPHPGIVESIVDPTDCLTPLLRSLRKVSFNVGPTVTGKRTTSDGAAVWTVTFTAVAGDPWEYGDETPVIEGFLDPAVDVPWAGGVIPAGGFVDLDGAIFTEDSCLEPTFSVISDPLCPALIPPPLPPSVSLGCFELPANWRRRQITLPATFIPLWGEVVPKFSIHARDDDVRNLRLRFYADVEGDGDISDDPCAYCGDIIVSYVPQGFTLVVDGSEQTVYAVDATQRRHPVSNLLFASDGTPFDWPVLSCGMGYIVTLDLPQTQPPPVFDLSLYARAA